MKCKLWWTQNTDPKETYLSPDLHRRSLFGRVDPHYSRCYKLTESLITKKTSVIQWVATFEFFEI